MKYLEGHLYVKFRYLKKLVYTHHSDQRKHKFCNIEVWTCISTTNATLTEIKIKEAIIVIKNWAALTSKNGMHKNTILRNTICT